MVFAVEGMHCASCGLLVDEVVEEVTGVVSSATDVRAGRTVVTVGGDVDPATVLAAIDGAGYAARTLS
jgi:copper chaperone CopZ